jgi:hypothetical protein
MKTPRMRRGTSLTSGERNLNQFRQSLLVGRTDTAAPPDDPGEPLHLHRHLTCPCRSRPRPKGRGEPKAGGQPTGEPDCKDPHHQNHATDTGRLAAPRSTRRRRARGRRGLHGRQALITTARPRRVDGEPHLGLQPVLRRPRDPLVLRVPPRLQQPPRNLLHASRKERQHRHLDAHKNHGRAVHQHLHHPSRPLHPNRPTLTRRRGLPGQMRLNR